VGDISLKTQVKLLGVIEEKWFERVGESTSRQADVRIIAATHRNLRKMVKQGLFREDLYFRLKVFEVSLPPLRERLDDLPLLINNFCNLFNQTYKKMVEGVMPEVLNIFMNYDWPGNVRELKHVLEHAFVKCRGNTITLEDLPPEIGETPVAKSQAPPKNFSYQELMEALTRTDWNKAKAARLLGISRPTLYRLLALHNLSE
jgi:two-component system response regulator HydG